MKFKTKDQLLGFSIATLNLFSGTIHFCFGNIFWGIIGYGSALLVTYIWMVTASFFC